MKTKTIKLYTYDELSKEAKETALNYFRLNNDYPFLSEQLTESLKALLEENNIKFDYTLKLYYDLSYSQGAGLCFIGNFEFKDINDIRITHNSYYYHSKTTHIQFFNNEGLEIEENQEFLNIYYSICDKLEKEGRLTIDEEQSEEYIKNMCEANDYTFRENGVIENE